MRIDCQQPFRLLVACFCPPSLAPAQEKALVAAEAIDNRRFLAFEGQFVGLVGNAQTPEITNVLAGCKFAVDGQAVDDHVAVVLGGQLVLKLLKAGVVLLVPPVAQIAVAIELAPLVVEAVADFMADDGSNAAVVDRIIRLHVEKWRLQNGRGENDFVPRRLVDVA